MTPFHVTVTVFCTVVLAYEMAAHTQAHAAIQAGLLTLALAEWVVLILQWRAAW